MSTSITIPVYSKEIIITNTINKPTKFNWIVHGKRFDIETEVDKSVQVKGEGPYKYVQKGLLNA